MTIYSQPSTRMNTNNKYSAPIWPLIGTFVIIKLLIHLYTNTFAGYGIFRDELYMYACSLRPDFGYVDHPPLSVWILNITILLLGKSLFAMRLVPALFGAFALIPLNLSVQLLGGGRKAAILASIAFILSPIYLAYCGYYSMNSIDILLWTCAIYLVIKLQKSQDPKYWIWLGAVMGLALLNKIGMLWFGFGLFLSLILTSDRRWLTTKWPYLAGIVAFIMFSPYLIWNALHDWPTIEFLGGAARKYDSQSPLSFLSGQFLINNPSNIIIWVAGIIWLIQNRKDGAARTLAIIFLTILGILLINGNTKPEYLSQIFSVLFVAGAILIEKWSENRKFVMGAVVAIQLTGMVVIPLAIPILPVESFITYSKSLGMAPSTTEGHDLAELPQFYADMFGWENQAKSIAAVYHSLSPEDKSICAIFGDNYGRSGAIDYFSDKYDLPLSIGSHNNYWIWGPGEFDGKVILILSDEVGDKADYFEEVRDMGVINSPYAIPYEDNLHIYLCKNLRIPVEELWPQIKNYN
jgi:hypothetical protein